MLGTEDTDSHYHIKACSGAEGVCEPNSYTDQSKLLGIYLLVSD